MKEHARTFDLRFQEAFSRSPVPGASAALFYRGDVHVTFAGVLNSASRARVAADALFQVGSITKVFTATLIMREIERGALTLDTKIVQVLPDFQLSNDAYTAALTVGDLLTHRGGFEGDVDGDFGRGDDAIGRFVSNLRTLPVGFPPGTVMSYSNSGFVVLGAVLEAVGGRPWAAQMQDLFTAAGVPEAWVYPEDAVGWRTAHGHLLAPDPVPHPLARLPWAQAPAGAAVVMSARSLALFGARLSGAAPWEGLLSADSIAAMQTRRSPAPSIGAPGKYRGLGWELDARHGEPQLVGHNGQTYGQSAYLWAVPEAEFAAALLVNSDDDGALVDATIAGTIEELLGITPPRPSHTLADLDDELTSRVQGVYRTASRTVRIADRTALVRFHEHVDELTGHDDTADYILKFSAADGYLVAVDQAGQVALRFGIPSDASDRPTHLYMGNRAVPRVG